MVFSVQYYSLLYYSVSICIEFIDFFLHLFFKNLSISIIRLLLSPQNFSIFHRRKEISLYSIPSLKFINFSFISSQNFHRYEFSCAIPSQNLLIFLLFSKFLDFLIFLYFSSLQNYSRRFSTFSIFHKFLSSYPLLKIYQFSKSILSLSLSLFPPKNFSHHAEQSWCTKSCKESLETKEAPVLDKTNVSRSLRIPTPWRTLRQLITQETTKATGKTR